MKPIPIQAQSNKSELERRKRQLQFTVGVARIGESVAHGHADQALVRAMSLGTKLAASDIFYEEQVPILTLVDALKKFGNEVLIKSPETLFALIDKTYKGKTDKEAADDIEHFHKTGELRTKVPLLVRNKIYAIRTASISDAPYEEWNIFEKVGGAFNGRVANFSAVEPLSAGECAVTVALLDAIRPDRFSNEVKIYIAACCHQDGFETVDPVLYLAISEEQLQQLNLESRGHKTDRTTVASIRSYMDRIRSGDTGEPSDESEEYKAWVQAGKLLGAQLMAEEALRGSYEA